MSSAFLASRSAWRSTVAKRSFTTSRVSRNASTSDAQKKATEKLQDLQNRGQKAFEDVKDSKAWSQTKAGFDKVEGSELWAKTKNALGPYGEKAGNLLGAYKEPIYYNTAVTKEFCKQLYVKELQPPKSWAEIRTAYAEIWSKSISPVWWRSVFENGEAGRLTIYALQAYGLFEIGEMLGRLNMIGYNIH